MFILSQTTITFSDFQVNMYIWVTSFMVYAFHGSTFLRTGVYLNKKNYPNKHKSYSRVPQVVVLYPFGHLHWLGLAHVPPFWQGTLQTAEDEMKNAQYNVNKECVEKHNALNWLKGHLLVKLPDCGESKQAAAMSPRVLLCLVLATFPKFSTHYQSLERATCRLIVSSFKLKHSHTKVKMKWKLFESAFYFRARPYM